MLRLDLHCCGQIGIADARYEFAEASSLSQMWVIKAIPEANLHLLLPNLDLLEPKLHCSGQICIAESIFVA